MENYVVYKTVKDIHSISRIYFVSFASDRFIETTRLKELATPMSVSIAQSISNILYHFDEYSWHTERL